MGWAGGSEVANDFITHPKVQRLPDADRKGVFEALLGALSGNDWDTIDESMGIDPMFDEVIREELPKWFTENDL